MDWDTGWFVDDNDIVIFVNNTNFLGRHRRFVAMECMRYHISILYSSINGRDQLPIKHNLSRFYRLFLHLALDSI